jgi:uncharacterized protein involved in exopolysaccharide biosynthesis/Mrp family chromosome partitioning ATPase
MIFLFWTALYLLIFYQPVYKSNAKILIKDSSNDFYVTELNDENILKPLTSTGNPLLTQMELLKSKQLEDRLKTYIKKHMPDQNINKFSMSGHLKTNLKAGTDVLLISFTWENPEKAKELLEVTLKEYDNLNLSIINKLKIQRRQYIDIKINEIKQKLQKAREEIRDYKYKNVVSDLDTEGQSDITQKTQLKSELQQLNASIHKAGALKANLQAQLKLKPGDAIKAVALGSGNTTLTKLSDDLNQANQEYFFDLTKYSDTNPKIIAQKNKIEIIKAQIKKQIELSLGGYIKQDKVLRVYDPVREGMVKDLVTANSDYISLQAQRNSLSGSLRSVNSDISNLSKKQYMMSSLQQEEANLANAYNELRAKQIEAKIQEAESGSNASIIDYPSLPGGISFPSKANVMILALMAGFLISVLASFLKTIIEDVCDDIDIIEQLTKKSIIGIIPWIDEPIFDEDKTEFMNKIAYSNIISTLMVRCHQQNINTLTFTSTSFKKPHSTIINKIAETFINLGHSVLIIDTDFRLPACHVDKDYSSKNTKNFSNLILEVENLIKKKMPINDSIITDTLIVDQKGVHHLVNREYSLESFEFLGSLGYNYIIKTLSRKFDWVFIDTSAAHVTPEFLLVAKQSDGVVLFVNKTATYSVLTSLVKNLKIAEIPIIGTIMRKKNVHIENEYENYIKHQYEKLIAEEKIETELEEAAPSEQT